MVSSELYTSSIYEQEGTTEFPSDAADNLSKDYIVTTSTVS